MDFHDSLIMETIDRKASDSLFIKNLSCLLSLVSFLCLDDSLPHPSLPALRSASKMKPFVLSKSRRDYLSGAPF